MVFGIFTVVCSCHYLSSYSIADLLQHVNDVTRGKFVIFTFPLFAVIDRLLKFSPIHNKFEIDGCQVTHASPCTSLSTDEPGEMSERAGQVCINFNTEVLMYSMNFYSMDSNHNMQQLLLCGILWTAGSIFISQLDTKIALNQTVYKTK